MGVRFRISVTADNLIGLPMTGSTATAKSRSEDPGHHEVFIMGYDSDKPNVLMNRTPNRSPRTSMLNGKFV